MYLKGQLFDKSSLDQLATRAFSRPKGYKFDCPSTLDKDWFLVFTNSLQNDHIIILWLGSMWCHDCIYNPK